MSAFWWILFGGLGYLVAGRLVASRYNERRHGTTETSLFEPGSGAFLFVALTWPVTMFADWVRNPELCDDREHLLLRARIFAEYERGREADRALLAEYGDHRRRGGR